VRYYRLLSRGAGMQDFPDLEYGVRVEVAF